MWQWWDEYAVFDISLQKITGRNVRGPQGTITTVVGHFQTHAISNVLVKLCSGTDEPHSGSGRDFLLVGI
jgi:hypothetical protein